VQPPLTSVDEPGSPTFSPTLHQAAERIDPVAYQEVALALVATDVPISYVRRLGQAIRETRGEDCYRHFMGEYADLVWNTIREDLDKGRSELQ
jgi:hypothetical protein